MKAEAKPDCCLVTGEEKLLLLLFWFEKDPPVTLGSIWWDG